MNIKQLVNILILVPLIFSVGACKSISASKKIDYKSTKTVPPLDVPPGLSSLPSDESQADLYGVPGGTTTYSSYSVDRDVTGTRSTGTSLLQHYDNVTLEHAGGQRWLVVQVEPEKLWPTIREFLLKYGLIIAREDPKTGTIETEWAENRALVGTKYQRVMFKVLGSLYSTGTRDKYRVRLERGAEPGTTEIYLSHRSMKEVVSDAGGSSPIQTVWQPGQSDPILEAEMLRLLMVEIGIQNKRAEQLLAEGTIPERAKLSSGADGRLALNLQDSLDRAWRRVGLSLDRIGLTVEDRDRSKGIYYVRDAGAEEESKKRGFFSRLFRRNKDEPADREYLVSIKSVDSGTDVEILDQNGSPINVKHEERILSLLYEQLK